MATPARTTTIALAWVGAVVGATLIGLTAVGAIGDGLVGPGASRVLDASEVDAQLAAQLASAARRPDPVPVVPSETAEPPTTLPVPSEPAPTVLAVVGGVVVARCDGRVVEVISVTPAQGYREDGRIREDGRVRFEGEDGGVELSLSCRNGEPVAIEEPAARPARVESTPPAAPTPRAEPATDRPPMTAPRPGAEPSAAEPTPR